MVINLLRCLCFLFLSTGSLAAQDPDEQHVFYVSSISWHTGIVIPASAFPDSLWTQGHDYSDALFLEIGWGEADYYPHEGFNLWYAFKSVFWPTPSVIHINPLYREVEDYYSDTDVVRIEVSEQQFAGLNRFLIGSFKLNKNGEIIPAAEGKRPDSHFYESRQSYYFPKNSNVWAARAIKNAGFSISPFLYQTTGCLLNKAEDFGELIVDEE